MPLSSSATSTRPAYFGLPLVRDKAFLAPLAHDEWGDLLPSGTAFSSPSRRHDLQYGSGARNSCAGSPPRPAAESPVIGVGIDPPVDVPAAQFRYGLPTHGPDPSLRWSDRRRKRMRVALHYFGRARAKGGLKHKLVLIGREVMPIPFDETSCIWVLPDEEKWAALAACNWLVMPSPHESLSMALLEAWSVGTPACERGVRCSGWPIAAQEAGACSSAITKSGWRALVSLTRVSRSSPRRQRSQYVESRVFLEPNRRQLPRVPRKGSTEARRPMCAHRSGSKACARLGRYLVGGQR